MIDPTRLDTLRSRLAAVALELRAIAEETIGLTYDARHNADRWSRTREAATLLLDATDNADGAIDNARRLAAELAKEPPR